MEKEKITYEQMIDRDFRRSQQLKIKSEAVWSIFHDLDGLINISRFSKEYFGKSQSWFAQKLQGMKVCGRRRHFTPEEYSRISASFRQIAERLELYADQIDAAEDA